MSDHPDIRLHCLGAEPLARALAQTGAPHLPQSLLSDHYAVGNRALHQALSAKIARLLDALAPQLQGTPGRWQGTAPDVLALDLAFVEHPGRPFELAWVEIQAFTSMLPTFHTVHLAQRRIHRLPTCWLPHEPAPPGSEWLGHMRNWVAPDPCTVLIEDLPRSRFNWPDLDAARHWWNVDVHDWRDLLPDHGHLRCTGTSRRYAHVWNRLILSDLGGPDRARAETLFLAADRLGWHSHPAWYERIDKGSLAGLPLAAHEACHWVEEGPAGDRQWQAAEDWVAKPVGGHSGQGLLLAPTTTQLRSLPRPRQWIVQRRFRQRPLGRHPQTGQLLFGELRCMLGLRAGKAPWVMAWLMRCSTDGVATLTGRRTAPGEGLTLLYFDSSGH